jgi:hypothetical protein
LPREHAGDLSPLFRIGYRAAANSATRAGTIRIITRRRSDRSATSAL